MDGGRERIHELGYPSAVLHALAGVAHTYVCVIEPVSLEAVKLEAA